MNKGKRQLPTYIQLLILLVIVIVLSANSQQTKDRSYQQHQNSILAPGKNNSKAPVVQASCFALCRVCRVPRFPGSAVVWLLLPIRLVETTRSTQHTALNNTQHTIHTTHTSDNTQHIRHMQHTTQHPCCGGRRDRTLLLSVGGTLQSYSASHHCKSVY